MQPSLELDQNLADGIVAEKTFVEQFDSDAQHSQEVLDEDDAFLGSAAPEVWEYEVVDARASEFEQAIAESDLVLEFDVVDTTPTSNDEIAGAVLKEGSVYPLDQSTPAAGDPQSGVRAGDDGPAGMPTGDPSAGGLGGGRGATVANDAEGMVHAGSGNIDDLEVRKANDSGLGLTNRGKKPAEDWAANTGSGRNAAVNINPADARTDQSTLSPPKSKKRA